ncbi:hypothetical protein ScalyP_jg6163, partial [Parmales sp. scaly parma]
MVKFVLAAAAFAATASADPPSWMESTPIQEYLQCLSPSTPIISMFQNLDSTRPLRPASHGSYSHSYHESYYESYGESYGNGGETESPQYCELLDGAVTMEVTGLLMGDCCDSLENGANSVMFAGATLASLVGEESCASTECGASFTYALTAAEGTGLIPEGSVQYWKSLCEPEEPEMSLSYPEMSMSYSHEESYPEDEVEEEEEEEPEEPTHCVILGGVLDVTMLNPGQCCNDLDAGATAVLGGGSLDSLLNEAACQTDACGNSYTYTITAAEAMNLVVTGSTEQWAGACAALLANSAVTAAPSVVPLDYCSLASGAMVLGADSAAPLLASTQCCTDLVAASDAMLFAGASYDGFVTDAACAADACGAAYTYAVGAGESIGMLGAGTATSWATACGPDRRRLQDGDGEFACENRGYDAAQCASVGCCEWDDGNCWFAGVFTSACNGSGGAGEEQEEEEEEEVVMEMCNMMGIYDMGTTHQDCCSYLNQVAPLIIAGTDSSEFADVMTCHDPACAPIIMDAAVLAQQLLGLPAPAQLSAGCALVEAHNNGPGTQEPEEEPNFFDEMSNWMMMKVSKCFVNKLMSGPANFENLPSNTCNADALFPYARQWDTVCPVLADNWLPECFSKVGLEIDDYAPEFIDSLLEDVPGQQERRLQNGIDVDFWDPATTMLECGGVDIPNVSPQAMCAVNALMPKALPAADDGSRWTAECPYTPPQMPIPGLVFSLGNCQMLLGMDAGAQAMVSGCEVTDLEELCATVVIFMAQNDCWAGLCTDFEALPDSAWDEPFDLATYTCEGDCTDCSVAGHPFGNIPSTCCSEIQAGAIQVIISSDKPAAAGNLASANTCAGACYAITNLVLEGAGTVMGITGVIAPFQESCAADFAPVEEEEEEEVVEEEEEVVEEEGPISRLDFHSLPNDMKSMLSSQICDQIKAMFISGLDDDCDDRCDDAFSLVTPYPSYLSKCAVSGQCFSSVDYSANEYCEFTLSAGLSGQLVFSSFAVEESYYDCYDYLAIGGTYYCTGREPPTYLPISGGSVVRWQTDNYGQRTGFFACFVAATVCGAGEYSHNGECDHCPANTFGNGTAARTSCTPCSGSGTAPSGSDEASDCTYTTVSCGAGYYSHNGE